MNKRIKKKINKKIPKTKQLEKSINAWKEFPEIYNNIIDLAEMYGVLKRGGALSHNGNKYHISTAKKNIDDTLSFIKAFNEQFKPKSVKVAKMREKYNRMFSKEEQKEMGKSAFKQFVTNEIVYSSMVRELFNYFPSKESRKVFDYTDKIDRASAINELRNYMRGARKGNNVYVTEYEDKYGFDMQPPTW